MSTPYEISDQAYATIILHCSKYVNAVNGVLFGKQASNGTVKIELALPIAHSALAMGTTPLTETALHLAEAKAQQLDLELVGAYYGNEVADDASIGTFPTRIADAVRANFAPACLLMIDAARLAPRVRQTQHCMRVCVRESDTRTWARGTRPSNDLAVSAAALDLCHRLLQGKVEIAAVIDFEDHCLDATQDWFNTKLISQLSSHIAA